MTVGELSRRVGRSADTIKRWEEENLLSCSRDSRGRRIYDETHVALCLRLADLALIAQRRSEKLKILAAEEPVQLAFALSPELQRFAS